MRESYLALNEQAKEMSSGKILEIETHTCSSFRKILAHVF